MAVEVRLHRFRVPCNCCNACRSRGAACGEVLGCGVRRGAGVRRAARCWGAACGEVLGCGVRLVRSLLRAGHRHASYRQHDDCEVRAATWLSALRRG
ncbi:hypothetical protein ACFPM0_25995 [Pseudonocardia sulfidoxydans]|uniref:hypothetical protein n=1 Tax=Pseudonocardia sulfidoxydans TaxID=54011 RepID=UPI0036082EEC